MLEEVTEALGYTIGCLDSAAVADIYERYVYGYDEMNERMEYVQAFAEHVAERLHGHKGNIRPYGFMREGIEQGLPIIDVITALEMSGKFDWSQILRALAPNSGVSVHPLRELWTSPYDWQSFHDWLKDNGMAVTIRECHGYIGVKMSPRTLATLLGRLGGTLLRNDGSLHPAMTRFRDRGRT
jgi:hypothetical protein